MRIGVLIIGSLYWDNEPPIRGLWRTKRLDGCGREYVRVPIRYGRRSRKRGDTYTMVFSPGLDDDEFGTAIAVPCRSHNLIEEAEWLWAAEDPFADGPPCRVSTSWGCVALLENPRLRLPDHVRNEWTARVSQEKDYGKLICLDGEDGVVDKSSGTLSIPWPSNLDGSPLKLNALLATTNSPTPTSDDRGYPWPQEIADAWNRRTAEGCAEVDYFWKNRKHGITTHQDRDIQVQLKVPPELTQ